MSKLLKQYTSIRVSFESYDSWPIKSIRSLFLIVKKELNLNCKICTGIDIKDEDDTLNIVFVRNRDDYNKYMNYTELDKGFPPNLLLASVSDEDSLHEIKYLKRLDILIESPFRTNSVVESILRAIDSKTKRTKLYIDLEYADDLLNESRYDESMQLINKSLKENDSITESIIIKSNIYEQQGNITAALQTLHMALEVNPDDYFLLVELHKFMFKYHMFDQADVILTKILNSFQPDEETLKSIVANSIKLKQFNIIKKILDFITVQNLLYKRSLRKFMDVAYYILIKDIITENKSEDLTKYLKMMIQDIQDSPSFTKIAEVAAQNNNKSSGLLQAIFMESKIHLKYFTLIDILLNSNRMIKAQLVNKCIELIDFEKIRVSKVYNILIKTLGEINMDAEKEQYQRKLEVFKRDNI